MKSIRFAALLFLVAVQATARAPKAPDPGNPKTAGDLLQDCRALDQPASYQKGVCVSFIDATWQSTNLLNYYKHLCAGGKSPDKVLCVPNDVSFDEVVRAAVRYIEQHPERHRQLAYGEVLDAIHAAWPCTSAKK